MEVIIGTIIDADVAQGRTGRAYIRLHLNTEQFIYLASSISITQVLDEIAPGFDYDRSLETIDLKPLIGIKISYETEPDLFNGVYRQVVKYDSIKLV